MLKYKGPSSASSTVLACGRIGMPDFHEHTALHKKQIRTLGNRWAFCISTRRTHNTLKPLVVAAIACWRHFSCALLLCVVNNAALCRYTIIIIYVEHAHFLPSRNRLPMVNNPILKNAKAKAGIVTIQKNPQTVKIETVQIVSISSVLSYPHQIVETIKASDPKNTDPIRNVAKDIILLNSFCSSATAINFSMLPDNFNVY